MLRVVVPGAGVDIALNVVVKEPNAHMEHVYLVCCRVAIAIVWKETRAASTGSVNEILRECEQKRECAAIDCTQSRTVDEKTRENVCR